MLVKPTIKFDYFDNADQRKMIEELFERVPNLWPSYAYEIRVLGMPTDPEKPSGAACCVPNPEYRRVTIYICPNFFAAPKEDWLRNIIEEVLHSLFGEFDEWFQKDVMPLIGANEPNLAKVFTNQYGRLWEKFTNELVAIHMRGINQ